MAPTLTRTDFGRSVDHGSAQRGEPARYRGARVPRVGSVRATGDQLLPWVVVDSAGVPVGPVSAFLRDLLACGSSPASCRSYGYDLLRWFRFLAAVEVGWRGRAQRSEVRDFVLWLRTCHNRARDRRRPDMPAPGSVNPRTGKAYLRAGYAPATINRVQHSDQPVRSCEYGCSSMPRTAEAPATHVTRASRPGVEVVSERGRRRCARR